MLDLDTNDLARRYLAGETLQDLANPLGIQAQSLAARFRKLGIPTRSKAQNLDLIRSFDINDAMRRYQSGETELAIALSTGISRPALRRRLINAGIHPRGMREAQAIRYSNTTPEQRLALTEAAHAAVRGVPQTYEDLCKRAIGREAKARIKSDMERIMIGWLGDRGVEVVPQKAIGPYNVDIAITSSRIAVEIFGGNWHGSGRHAARYRKRCDHLIDADWLPIIVWVTRSWPLSQGAADYIVALHQARRDGESGGGQEHVIGGRGELSPVAEVKSHNGAVVLGHNPRNNQRGTDGRFR